MEQVRVIKKQIVMDLDKNEAPSNPRWVVDRILRFPDGAERPVPDTIALTVEEMRTHLGQAFDAQAADIARDGQERDALRAKLADALAALQAVEAADASWDDTPRAQVAAVLEANRA